MIIPCELPHLASDQADDLSLTYPQRHEELVSIVAVLDSQII